MVVVHYPDQFFVNLTLHPRRLTRLFAPVGVREDGTREFKSPMGEGGSIPLIALEDLGWWVRYIFDNPSSTTGKNLEVASHPTTFPEIVETFKKVTGKNAVFVKQTVDEWFENFTDVDRPLIPVAPGAVPASGAKTFKQNFS